MATDGVDEDEKSDPQKLQTEARRGQQSVSLSLWPVSPSLPSSYSSCLFPGV
jgi:hypothetical protein